jgi:hypothetical protein
VRFFLSRAYSKTFRQILAYLDRLPIDPKDVNLGCEEFGEIGETATPLFPGMRMLRELKIIKGSG